MASPICTVNGSATSGGVNVTSGSTVTIQLADLTGVNSWSISCSATDDSQSSTTINAGLSINNTTKTCTFTAPTSTTGVAMQFKSVVNGGINSSNAVDPSLTSTFGIYIVTATSGARVMFVGETIEGDAANGWSSKFNYAVRNSGSATTTRQQANDSNMILRYKFNEANGATTFANSGTLSNANLTVSVGTPVAGCSGPFGYSVYLPACALSGHAVSTLGLNGSAFTVDTWFKAYSFNQTQELVVFNWFNNSSYTWPYATCTLGMTTGGQIRAGIKFVGSNNSWYVSATSGFQVQSGQWNHFGMSWNGTSLNLYANGVKVSTQTDNNSNLGGAVDFANSSGNVTIGGFYPAGQEYYTGWISDLIVHNEVKNDAYFLSTYQNAMAYASKVLV